MSWSLDPVTGKPTFVKDSDADKVELYSPDDVANETNRQRGIKTPGWVFYSQHTRADGHIKRRIEPLVTFRSNSWKNFDPVDPVDPETTSHLNPPLSVTLGWGPSYTLDHNPFVNWFKMARPWMGPGDGIDRDWDDLVDLEAISPTGELLSIPSDQYGISTFIMDNLNDVPGISGRYRLTWEGTCDASLSLAAENVDYSVPNQIDFDYTPTGTDMVYFIVENIIEGPIRNFKLIHHDDLDLEATGAFFRPEWLDTIKNYRILRFKDWMNVDNSTHSLWSERAHPDDAMYTRSAGVPIERMVELCNLVGADGWFVLPHMADDNYAEECATLAFNNLRQEQHAYIEYSNKCWDFNLEQAHWCAQQGDLLWGEDGDNFGHYYGGRTAEIAMIWQDVWGAENPRLHTVLQVFTDYLGFEELFLNATKWVADDESRSAPYTYCTEYAVHALIDGGFGTDEAVPIMDDWIATLTEEQIYTRMQEQCRDSRYIEGQGRVVDVMKARWTHHKSAADNFNLNLICYEGGSHMVTPWERQGNTQYNHIYNTFNFSQRYADLLLEHINNFYDEGGLVYNNYADCYPALPVSNIGIRRYIGDNNPRVTTIETFTATHNGPEDRGEFDFIGSYEIEEES